MIEAAFADLNAAGGIYGRRLELRIRRAGSPEEARAAAEALMTGGEVFALLAPFSDGLDAELAELAETHKVPVVAPFTGDPRRGRPGEPPDRRRPHRGRLEAVTLDRRRPLAYRRPG